MTIAEKARVAEHAGHEVEIVDYMPGEPMQKSDDDAGRFCLECVDCGEILLGARVMVGSCKAISVTVT